MSASILRLLSQKVWGKGVDRIEPGKSMFWSLSKHLFLQKYLAEQSNIEKKNK